MDLGEWWGLLWWLPRRKMSSSLSKQRFAIAEFFFHLNVAEFDHYHDLLLKTLSDRVNNTLQTVTFSYTMLRFCGHCCHNLGVTYYRNLSFYLAWFIFSIYYLAFIYGSYKMINNEKHTLCNKKCKNNIKGIILKYLNKLQF